MSPLIEKISSKKGGRFFMQEIKVKGNEKLKVYINGKPKLEYMPKDVLDSFVNSLYKQVIEKVEKKRK